MKKFLCEIYNVKTGENIHYIEIEDMNFFNAEGEARSQFSILFRHTKRFSNIGKDIWRVRSVEI